MIRGTTPNCGLVISGYDLTGTTVEVYIKTQDGNVLLTKTGSELTVTYGEEEEGASVILMRLSQEETLQLPEGYARIQVRWIDAEGTALATEDRTVPVGLILNPTIIEYRGE